MAKAKSSTVLSGPFILEASVTVNPRGRSVVTGTVMIPDENAVRSFKYELSDSEKAIVRDLIISNHWHLGNA